MDDWWLFGDPILLALVNSLQQSLGPPSNSPIAGFYETFNEDWLFEDCVTGSPKDCGGPKDRLTGGLMISLTGGLEDWGGFKGPSD